MTTPQLPPPSNPAMLPVLGAVTYVAGVVALWGILSLVLDRDPIDYPDAGPLLGPSMVVLATVVTWLVSWRAKRPLIGAVIAFIASWLGMLVVAVIGYPGSPLEVAIHFAISPFIAGAAVLSAFTVLGVAALRRAPRDSR